MIERRTGRRGSAAAALLPAARRPLWARLGVAGCNARPAKGTLFALLCAVAACTSELDLSLDGKQCRKEAPRCVSGYACDPATNLCVRPESLASGGDGGAPASGGTGGAAFAGAGGDGGSAGTSAGSGAMTGGASGALMDAGQGGAHASMGGTGPVVDAATESDSGAEDAGDPQCTPVSLYRDADGDGIGRTDDAQVRCPAPGWVAQAGDCRDDQPDVFLGQTGFFGTPYPDATKPGNVSFDYDCSGSEQADPGNDPSTPLPNCTQALNCTGSGYLPASPARNGAGIEPRCGSVDLRQCIAPGGLLTCEADDLTLAPQFAFRCR